jgi:hypothetical protein
MAVTTTNFSTGEMVAGSAMGLAGAGMQIYGAIKGAEDSASATQYNMNLINLNLNRQLKELQEKRKVILGSNYVDSAARGVSVASPAFAVIQNNNINNFEDEAIELKENARRKEQSMLFQYDEEQDREDDQMLGGILQGVGAAAAIALAVV